MMSNERKLELFDGLLEKVFEKSSEEYKEYAEALKWVGFTEGEVKEELIENCGLFKEEVKAICDELYH